MLKTAPASLTQSEAVRFLQRSTFGGSPSDVDRLMREGVDSWWQREVAETPSNSLYDLLSQDNNWDQSIWQRYFSGNALLRKRLGFTLSQIFVSANGGANRFAVAGYSDLLEQNCTVTYRELLEKISKSVAMGEYLTYHYNFKAVASTGQMPDENYAREILQLFSIGLVELNIDGSVRTDSSGNAIPTYDQDDILGLARVFTGWYPNPDIARPEHLRRPMVNNPNWHSPEAKSFLGSTIPANTSGEASLQRALNTIANHPNVAPFISRQLIQRLIGSNPTPGFIRRVATVFNNDGNGVRGNLEAVFRAILTDTEAWAPPTARSGKLREPVLRLTVVMRALGLNSSITPWSVWSTSDPAEKLGQMPYGSPSVFNFYRPGYTPPNSELANRGLVGPEFQIANETSVLGWVNYLAEFLAWSRDGLSFDYSGLIDLTDRPAALVAELAKRIVGRPLTAATNQTIVNSVTQVSLWDSETTALERIHGAVLLIAASPDFLYDR